MKSLFEIETGYIGESYERCHIWADSAEQAARIFDRVYGDDGTRVATLNPSLPRKIHSLKLLFSADSPEFITVLSDSGFDLVE